MYNHKCLVELIVLLCVTFASGGCTVAAGITTPGQYKMQWYHEAVKEEDCPSE